jgi:hypothetical protein
MHLSRPSWVHARALIVNSLISIRSVGELAGSTPPADYAQRWAALERR